MNRAIRGSIITLRIARCDYSTRTSPLSPTLSPEYRGEGVRSLHLQQLRLRPPVSPRLRPVADALNGRHIDRRGFVAPLAADVGEDAGDLLVGHRLPAR